MVYKIGDMIVYEGSDSVCRVSDVATFNFGGAGGDRLYYVLKPIHQDCVIYNPVDNAAAFSRPVITKDEAERIIDGIPGMETSEADSGIHSNHEAKQTAVYYESIIKTRDCADLIRLVMSLNKKKESMAKNDRHIGSIETTAMKRAESALFDELSVALDIPKEGVSQYIEARVRTKMGKNGA